MTQSRITMVGSFPPPVGGAAKNNALLFEALCEIGVPTTKLDVSASGPLHRRTLDFHAQRILLNFHVNRKIRKCGSKEAAFYIVPDGGLGAWYSLAHVSAAASRYGHLVIHHRTFRYIDTRSQPMARIVSAAGCAATHIFLSPGMAAAFQERYGKTRHIVASNARFVTTEAEAEASERRRGPLRIGHLSNLCRDKGFFQVADAYEAAAGDFPDTELFLAGPILETDVGTRLEALQSRYGQRVRHFGPLHGIEKRDFYRQIDLFLFPTQFAQEAAPNVVYEALAAGVPTLATDRGCLPEMLGGVRGAFCARNADFATFVKSYLEEFEWNTPTQLARSHAIKAALRDECHQSRFQYQQLLSILSKRDPAGGHSDALDR